MPVIELNKERLETLYPNKRYEELKAILPFIGLDIEGDYEDKIRVEYSPNRPDFSTDYGIVRALKGLFGDQLGRPRHKLERSGVVFLVDNSVQGVRPYVAGFTVEQLNVDDALIKQLITMQEDLHHGVGRERKKVAIGYHDLKAIKPPIRYTTVKLDHRFIPLGYERAMTLAEVLKETDKGITYGVLLAGSKYAPALLDDHETTLSIPPIINGAATTISTNTRGLLVDITGTDLEAVKYTASIIAETMWDAGGIVKSAVVKSNTKDRKYPTIRGRQMNLNYKYVNKTLGINLSIEKIVQALLKSRNDAEKQRGGNIKVVVPNYRIDIIHPIDLVEEIAYGYGYFNIKPDFDFEYSNGNLSIKTTFEDKIRELMVGLGFSEIITPVLTSTNILLYKMNRDTTLERVEFSKSSEHEFLRDMLLPGALAIIALNSDEQNPQNLFELGPTISGNGKEDTSLVAVIKNGDFSKIKSILMALLDCFNTEITLKKTATPYILRGGNVLNRESVLGEIGEVSPLVLEKFKINSPIAYFELKLSELHL